MSEEMTYAHLGRSGLMVRRIGLGTMNFGYTVDEPSSFAVMDAAIDAGINFFDTADNRQLSAYHIRRACEASLRRLQTDHIWRSGGTTRS